MIKLIAAATVVLAFATSAQAVPRTPLPQSESMITQVREGCGAGRVRINGVCVLRRAGYRTGYYGNNGTYGTYGAYNRGYYRRGYYGGMGYRPGVYGTAYRRNGYYGGRVARPAVRARAVRRVR
jgi:hypothetical protein